MRPGTRAGRLAIAAAAVTCVAAAAGCASSSSTPATPASTVTVTATPSAPAASVSGTPTATGASSAPAAPSACPTRSLRVTISSPNGYAGGTDQNIDFTNGGAASCTLYGYPGVSLVSGPPYTQIGLAARRGTTTPVKLVTLAPGGIAHAVLQIVDALNFPPSSCGPTKATYLRIYPPNQKVPVYLPSAAQGCAKPTQILYIGPVAPGR